MSNYSDVSKSIGWEGKAVIPSVAEAYELVDKARRGYIMSFTKLMRVNRFAPSPRDSKEEEALRVIVKGLAECRNIYM